MENDYKSISDKQVENKKFLEKQHFLEMSSLRHGNSLYDIMKEVVTYIYQELKKFVLDKNSLNTPKKSSTNPIGSRPKEE